MHGDVPRDRDEGARGRHSQREDLHDLPRLDRDRSPADQKITTTTTREGVDLPWQRVYGFTPEVARALQPRAAHPREGRVRDVPRRDRAADGRRAERRSHDGFLRGLSQGEAKRRTTASRVTSKTMSIDRRTFIKLTAVTGGAAASRPAANSPENQLIRSAYRRRSHARNRRARRTASALSVAAGCGTTVRVMQGGRRRDPQRPTRRG